MIRIYPDARYEYETAYRNVRQFGEELFHDWSHFPEDEYEEMALISYDNRDSRFSGWINRQREDQYVKRFHKWCYELGEIPF